MTSEVDPKVVSELKRRFELIMDNFANLHPVERGSTGSMVRLQCLLAPVGYPFEPEPWMDEQYLTPVMSDEEFHGDLYDPLFIIMMEKIQKKTREIEKIQEEKPWEK